MSFKLLSAVGDGACSVSTSRTMHSCLFGYERNLGGFLVEYRLAQNQSLLVYIPYNPKNRLAKGVRT